MERFENNKTSTVLLLKLQIQRLQDVYAHTTNVLTNYGQYMSPQNLMELSKKITNCTCFYYCIVKPSP